MTEVQVISAVACWQKEGMPQSGVPACLQAPWMAWQEHMTQLFRDFLVPAPAKVIWKEQTPQHHEGVLGINFRFSCRFSCRSCGLPLTTDSNPPQLCTNLVNLCQG